MHLVTYDRVYGAKHFAPQRTFPPCPTMLSWCTEIAYVLAFSPTHKVPEVRPIFHVKHTGRWILRDGTGVIRDAEYVSEVLYWDDVPIQYAEQMRYCANPKPTITTPCKVNDLNRKKVINNMAKKSTKGSKGSKGSKGGMKGGKGC